MAGFSLGGRRRILPHPEKKVPSQKDQDREVRPGEGAGRDLDVAAGPQEPVARPEADEGPVRVVEEGPAAAPEARHLPTIAAAVRQRELSRSEETVPAVDGGLTRSAGFPDRDPAA